MTKEFIDGCLQTGGKALSHGDAEVLPLFLHTLWKETFGMKYRDAFAYAQERRFVLILMLDLSTSFRNMKQNLPSKINNIEGVVPVNRKVHVCSFWYFRQFEENT